MEKNITLKPKRRARMAENLLKAQIDDRQAMAIADEIYYATRDFNPTRVMEMKIDQSLSHMDSKIHRIHIQLLQWAIIMGLIQTLLGFILNFSA